MYWELLNKYKKRGLDGLPKEIDSSVVFDDD